MFYVFFVDVFLGECIIIKLWKEDESKKEEKKFFDIFMVVMVS